jgi:hypothetical protein
MRRLLWLGVVGASVVALTAVAPLASAGRQVSLPPPIVLSGPRPETFTPGTPQIVAPTVVDLTGPDRRDDGEFGAEGSGAEGDLVETTSTTLPVPDVTVVEPGGDEDDDDDEDDDQEDDDQEDDDQGDEEHDD